MENFIYENTSRLIFGKHDESVIAAEIKRLGAKKVLVHYGQGSIVRSGLLGKITKALTDHKIKYVEYGGVVANPLREHTLAGLALAKKEKVDLVLAIGGGSVIDSAKCICAGLTNADIWSYYTDKTKKLPNPAAPLGVVLTIPAAGSEGSCASVMKDEATGIKYGLHNDTLRSRFAFVNPDYCETLPREQVAYGASDILAHMLERYFSPHDHVVATDKLLTGAIQAVLEIAPKAYKDPANYAYMAEFCLLGTLAHNGMLSLGRNVQAWEAHPIEMAFISGKYNQSHGTGLAIIFPAWLKHVAKTRPTKVQQFANEVMGEKSVALAIAKLEKWYKSLGLATTLKEVGIDVKDAIEVATVALEPKIPLGGYGQLTMTDIENIIRLAK